MAAAVPPREWRKEVKGVEFLISTSFDLLDLEMINDAFGTTEMYWAKGLETDTLRLMLQNSLTLGVYKVAPSVPPPASVSEPSTPRIPSPTIDGGPHATTKQIGLARFITDYVSTCYLTDVYVAPSHRGLDLGKWLVACCGEVIDSMPALRRAFLVATPGKGTDFYGKELGFWDASEEKGKIAVMTRRVFEM